MKERKMSKAEEDILTLEYVVKLIGMNPIYRDKDVIEKLNNLIKLEKCIGNIILITSNCGHITYEQLKEILKQNKVIN